MSPTPTSSTLSDDKNLTSPSVTMIQENDSALLTELSQKQRTETPLHAGTVKSGMEVATFSEIPVHVTPVDRRTIAGSTPGDSRDDDSDDFSTEKFKNQAGPRG